MSPVIGTIIMVAIAVVLAAVLFVMAREIGQGSGRDEPHNLVFAYDRLNGRFVVTKIDGFTDWSNLEVRSSSQGDLELNGVVAPGTLELAAGQFVPIAGGTTGRSDGRVQAADYLSLCIEPGPASDVSITIMQVSPNVVVYEGSILQLPDCP